MAGFCEHRNGNSAEPAFAYDKRPNCTELVGTTLPPQYLSSDLHYRGELQTTLQTSMNEIRYKQRVS